VPHYSETIKRGAPSQTRWDQLYAGKTVPLMDAVSVSTARRVGKKLTARFISREERKIALRSRSPQRLHAEHRFFNDDDIV